KANVSHRHRNINKRKADPLQHTAARQKLTPEPVPLVTGDRAEVPHREDDYIVDPSSHSSRHHKRAIDGHKHQYRTSAEDQTPAPALPCPVSVPCRPPDDVRRQSN